MAPKKKGAHGYKLPDPLPQGEILEDLTNKKWKLGPSIGQGGFGEIYSAQEVDNKSSKYPYVIKIEPHENGPLFVEINFYIRNAKPAEIEEFRKERKLKTFGMPAYLGSGSHECNSQKYRFLVLSHFGSDIWKVFLENNRTFPTPTVFKIAVQLLDILEYIHIHGYVHADIKGANILLGNNKETQNQVYLVDFGLASKFTSDPIFKPNPKRAHDGTIEYLSRDAHQGVQTKRGDLEILAYNMIQWLGCVLPWEKNLKTPSAVQESKDTHMTDIPNFMKVCFEGIPVPDALMEYLEYIKHLEFNSDPDYPKIRKLFLGEIKSAGDTFESPLNFKLKSPTKRKLAPVKKASKKVKQNGFPENEEASKSNEMEEGENSKPSNKKKINVAKKNKSNEMEEPKPASKKKTAEAKNKEKLLVDEYEGFTEEMKLISLRKKNTDLITSKSSEMEKEENSKPPNRKKTYANKGNKRNNMDEDVISKPDGKKKIAEAKANEKLTVDEYEGFTEEMKAIALKKKDTDNAISQSNEVKDEDISKPSYKKKTNATKRNKSDDEEEEENSEPESEIKIAEAKAKEKLTINEYEGFTEEMKAIALKRKGIDTTISQSNEMEEEDNSKPSNKRKITATKRNKSDDMEEEEKSGKKKSDEAKIKEKLSGDEYEGFTEEMKAISMKKKDTSTKNTKRGNSKKAISAEVTNGVTRSRRELKVVNYSETKDNRKKK